MGCDPLYYPPVDRQFLFNDGYIKQLTDMHSKYNMNYFNKMSPMFKICKKIWKPQDVSPSCGIAAHSSGIGTEKETPNTQNSFQTHSINKTIKKNSKLHKSTKGSNKKYNSNSKTSTNNYNSAINNNNKNNSHSKKAKNNNCNINRNINNNNN